MKTIYRNIFDYQQLSLTHLPIPGLELSSFGPLISSLRYT
jgi:hypothetical protein